MKLSISLADILCNYDHDPDSAEWCRWAIEWLGLTESIPDTWSDLDDAERDALVALGLVTEVTPEITCTAQQEWRDNWQLDGGAAWPSYTLQITAPGMEAMTVKGWHLVGPDEDGDWATRGDDSAYNGTPHLDRRKEWEIKSGHLMAGGGLIPCWSHEGRLCTLARSGLDDLISEAADTADHGDDPELSDLDWSDLKAEDTEYYLDSEGRVSEIEITQGTLYPSPDGCDERGRDQFKYLVTGWGWTGDPEEEIHATRKAAVKAALAHLLPEADDPEHWSEEREAIESAAELLLESVDLPDGLVSESDQFGWAIRPRAIKASNYHPTASEINGAIESQDWSSVLERMQAALDLRGVVGDLDYLDELIEEHDPWVTEEDSIDAGNCEQGTREFRIALTKRLGGRPGAVRSSFLLSIEDDQYTRRAARVAALKGRFSR